MMMRHGMHSHPGIYPPCMANSGFRPDNYPGNQGRSSELRPADGSRCLVSDRWHDLDAALTTGAQNVPRRRVM